MADEERGKAHELDTDAWEAYTPMRNASNKVFKAQYDTCLRQFSKRKHVFLKSHRIPCLKAHCSTEKNASPGSMEVNSESESEDSAVPSASSGMTKRQSAHLVEAEPHSCQNRRSTGSTIDIGRSALSAFSLGRKKQP
ncbi:hypothetical protein QAD02_005866 [Eretmocerus hayati]|uniref:Uncharacterized protein n=1 Tax=Eretmocerus hayati TaxID=131215 RepID=A0ACC2NTN2_9HYME|nr:hypothetical protein QAD02_005866 [Eretmocerus hayati]